VDLLSITPFYLPMLLSGDFLYVRAIRLMRLFRVFKMRRYSNSLKALTDVVRDKKEELFVTIFSAAVLLVVASGLIFHFEKEVQPEAFPDILAAMWWGIATLTNSGLGDVHPISLRGKAIGVLISLLGIGLFALPSGIIASGLIERIQKKRGPGKTCPHCGKQI
jgi:voltage-gated potassium channel